MRSTPIQRSESELKSLAGELRGLALYCHHYCPASIRISSLVQHLNLPLEFRDIRRSQVYRDDLISGLGHLCTPCLKIVEQGETRWLCGGDEVKHYLTERFAPQEQLRQAA